ncbi:MAG TPA: hypothetical protein GXX75_12715 [Clostridiales bacterium]|nr:hypothetical protein [Clostridiales bacterium]
MKGLKLEGVGRVSGGEYDSIKLQGVSSCSDNIKAEDIEIEGVFTCGGEVEAGRMYCQGVADFKSNIRAKKVIVSGVFNLKEGAKLEAAEISCEGVIRTGGEIYADLLRADGCITAREVYGDNITIETHFPVNRIVKLFKTTKSDIKLIEATTIKLSGVTADTVNGTDITIGPNCKINSIDCSGALYVDSSSTVENITGNYARREY